MRLLQTPFLAGIILLILPTLSAQDKLTELYYSGAYQGLIKNAKDLI